MIEQIVKKIEVKVNPKYKTGKKIYLFKDYYTRFQKFKNFFKFRYRKIVDNYYDIKYGIKSMWRWRKAIWQDRTWGDRAILNILIFKLKLDAAAFKNRNIIEDSEIVANQMLEVATLLEKYQNNKYGDAARKAHDEKWGEDEHYFVELLSGHFEWKSERDDRLNATDLEQEHLESRAIMENAEIERHADLKKALQLLEENLETWWD